MYLLDTNVISASAPTKSVVPSGFAEWMQANSASLYLSVVTVAEIEGGIAKARREGASRKASWLAEWLELVLHLYSARILALDVAAGRCLGRLSDRARALGQAPDFADLAIGATAQHYGHTILTRNLRHFLPLGLAAQDPFQNLQKEAVLF